MDHKEFDDILKNKLNQLASDKNFMPDWDRMNQQIEEDSLKDQAFDEQIKRKLDQINVSRFSPNSWNTLYELIDRRIKNKQRVFVSKSLEVSVLFLLIFTMNNLGIFQQNTILKPNQSTVTPIYAEVLTPSIQKEIDLTHGVTTDMETVVSESNSALIPTEILPNEVEASLLQKESTISVSSVIYSPTYESKAPIINQDNSSSVAELRNSSINPMDISLPNNDSHSENISLELVTEQETEDIIEMKEKAFKKLMPLVDANELESRAIYNVALIEKPIIRKTKQDKINYSDFHVSAKVSYQFNSIESKLNKSLINKRGPSDVNSNYSYIKKSANPAYEIQLAYELGRLSISSGINYQKVSYNPSIVVTTGNLTEKYRETTVESVGYEFIGVPLNLNAKLFKLNSWKVELQAGIIANILLKSKQQFQQNIVTGNRVTKVPASNMDLTALDYDFNEGILDAPSLNEDKSIINNLFYRANTGLSISKKVAPNTSIFGNINYLFQLPYLNSSTENLDQINTYSVGFGVKQFLG